MAIQVIFILLCLFRADLALADLQIIDVIKEGFSDGTLHLKNFSMEIENFKVLVNGSKTYNYGTQMISRFETESVSDLEGFGLAQEMRGCVYTSYLEENKVVTVFDYVVENYGQLKTFRFKDWLIDGFIPDPLDWGDRLNLPSRQNFYQWNTIPGSTDQGTSQYVFQKSPPSNPALYVKDIPGTAFINGNGKAKNISLQFRTCLYHSNEVSRNVPSDQINFATPIHCFDWSSSWVYDFQKQDYSSPSDISPVCF